MHSGQTDFMRDQIGLWRFFSLREKLL